MHIYLNVYLKKSVTLRGAPAIIYICFPMGRYLENLKITIYLLQRASKDLSTLEKCENTMSAWWALKNIGCNGLNS